jgi:hypothetical protein
MWWFRRFHAQPTFRGRSSTFGGGWSTGSVAVIHAVAGLVHRSCTVCHIERVCDMDPWRGAWRLPGTARPELRQIRPIRPVGPRSPPDDCPSGPKAAIKARVGVPRSFATHEPRGKRAGSATPGRLRLRARSKWRRSGTARQRRGDKSAVIARAQHGTRWMTNGSGWLCERSVFASGNDRLMSPARLVSHARPSAGSNTASSTPYPSGLFGESARRSRCAWRYRRGLAAPISIAC